MTKSKPKPQPPALTGRQIELIRLVARGWTNAQIAERFNCKTQTINCRISELHNVLGTAAGPGDPGGRAGVARARMTAWAYENGIATSVTPTPRDRTLTERAFEVCRQIVHKRPYLMVRAEAVAIIREADADLCADEAA